jgi:hypothetical protein
VKAVAEFGTRRDKMTSSVSEQVKVLAVFDEEGIKPLRFQWRGMTYSVKQITFRWKERKGGADIHRFAVSDGTNAFQLIYNSERLDWKVEVVDLSR